MMIARQEQRMARSQREMNSRDVARDRALAGLSS